MSSITPSVVSSVTKIRVSSVGVSDEPGLTLHRKYGIPTESALKRAACATCGFPGLETAFRFAGDSAFRFRACEVCRLEWQRSMLSGYEFFLQRQAERDAIARKPVPQLSVPTIGRQPIGRQHGCSVGNLGIGNLVREFVSDPDSEEDDEDWEGHWPAESAATIVLGRFTECLIILVLCQFPCSASLAVFRPGVIRDMGAVSLFLLGCVAATMICRATKKTVAATTAEEVL